MSSPSSIGMKREREKVHDFDLERNLTCDLSSRGGSDEEDGGTTRKKLRLSKEQSALLEESFKEHSTLNPKQKNALAKQLNLRPRQVEVWFQNRRARCVIYTLSCLHQFLCHCKRVAFVGRHCSELHISARMKLRLPDQNICLCILFLTQSSDVSSSILNVVVTSFLIFVSFILQDKAETN